MQEFEVLILEQRGHNGKTIGYTRPSGQNKVVHLEGLSSVTQSIIGSIFEFLRQVFLPYGFPESVSDDYVPYQLWDTLQAFCSTITGTLATKAIMEGVGVGSSEATPLAAAITWIFKDGTGMIGSILFAWWKGTSLDADCKKWRLVADVLNDVAFFIELSLPYLKSFSTLILCTSTAMKAVVGVAGGATRAALTQHQAIRENMADVSAKDGSQERFVNLVASLTGVFILTHIDGQFVWCLFFLLTVLHLYANYKAVKCLKMTTINNSRLMLLIDDYIRRGIVATPSKINSEESVFIGFGLSEKSVCGYHIELGSSIKNLVLHNLIKPDNIQSLKRCFGSSKYMIIPDIPSKTLFVLLNPDATASDIIKAYFHATLCGICVSNTCNLNLPITCNSKQSKVLERILKSASNVERPSPRKNELNTVIEIMFASNDIISEEFNNFYEGIQSKGWCCSSNLLHVGEWKAKWNCID